MNLKLLISTIVELIIAATVVVLTMVKNWGSDTMVFSIIYILIPVVIIPISIILRNKEYRIGIYYSVLILFYMIAFYIVYPDTLFDFEVGGFLIVTMLPLLVFILIPLLTYEKGIEISPRLITKWALVRFFLLLISFSFFAAAFSILWIPETNQFAIKVLIPGALLFSPFVMFASGYATYELFGKISEFEILKHHRIDIILSYCPWVLIILKLIFGLMQTAQNLQNVLNLTFIGIIFLIQIRIFIKYKMFERVFDKLYDYNPIKPRKNWYNKIITHIVIDLMILGALIYLIYMIFSIFQITPVYSWEQYISSLTLSGTLYIPLDPYLESYFFIGFIVNFTSRVFIKESVFSKPKF